MVAAQVKSLRVDKWLWAVRIFKTRSKSNDSCSSGRVRVNDTLAKPATKLVVGDLVEVRRRDRMVIVRVEALLDKRVSAALAAEAYEDLSPPAPEHRGRSTEVAVGEKRDRGTGRPTKRDRRLTEKFKRRSD